MVNDRGSVSPLEEGNNDEGGDEQDTGVENGGGDMWDRVFEPFDQDKEEEEEREKEMWQEAFGSAAVEGVKPEVVRTGYNPTPKEIEEHMVNHLPFRAWCRHCVKGKAKGLPHRVKYECEG